MLLTKNNNGWHEVTLNYFRCHCGEISPPLTLQALSGLLRLTQKKLCYFQILLSFYCSLYWRWWLLQELRIFVDFLSSLSSSHSLAFLRVCDWSLLDASTSSEAAAGRGGCYPGGWLVGLFVSKWSRQHHHSYWLLINFHNNHKVI